MTVKLVLVTVKSCLCCLESAWFHGISGLSSKSENFANNHPCALSPHTLKVQSCHSFTNHYILSRNKRRHKINQGLFAYYFFVFIFPWIYTSSIPAQSWRSWFTSFSISLIIDCTCGIGTSITGPFGANKCLFHVSL